MQVANGVGRSHEQSAGSRDTTVGDAENDNRSASCHSAGSGPKGEFQQQRGGGNPRVSTFQEVLRLGQQSVITAPDQVMPQARGRMATTFCASEVGGTPCRNHFGPAGEAGKNLSGHVEDGVIVDFGEDVSPMVAETAHGFPSFSTCWIVRILVSCSAKISWKIGATSSAPARPPG